MTKSNKYRNTNIEFIRLFAIFIIIINHYSLLGEFTFEDPLSANAIIIQFLHFGGKFGVNLFVFISGYYLSISDKINIRHIVKFLLEVTFYSIIFAIIGVAFSTLTTKEIIKMLIPIPFEQWPYVTYYFMLMCLSFWIHKFIYTLSVRQHGALLFFLGITYCIVPTFIAADFGMSVFTWYLYIYLFAGYIRRIIERIRYSGKSLIFISAVCIVLVLISELVFDWIGVHYLAYVGKHAEHFRSINSVFILIATVSLVTGVLKLRPRNNKFVQIIASTTLGIFLIHDNKAMIPLLWTGLFHTNEYSQSKFLLVHAILTCLIIMITCIILDLIRQITIGKLEDKVFGKLIEKLDKRVNSYLLEDSI